MSTVEAYDAWDHICADAFDDSRGIVAVVVARPLKLTAYFDESYNHPKVGSTEPRLYTVACYYGIRENWDSFRSDWNMKLAAKGLTDHGFHMKEFEFARSEVIAGKELPEDNPYRGWLRVDFDRFLNSLHEVIGFKMPSGLPRIAPVQSEVIKTDFDEIRPPELRDDPECASYYILCVANVMSFLANWASRNFYSDPIHYIFAVNKEEAGNLARWFAYCEKYPAMASFFRLGKGYSFLPYDTQLASKEPALQAADIAAYEINKMVIKWVERGFVDIPITDFRRSLDSLVQTKYWGWLLRKEELQQSFAEIIEVRKRFPV